MQRYHPREIPSRLLPRLSLLKAPVLTGGFQLTIKPLSIKYAFSAFLFFLAWTLPYHYYPWVSASQDLLAFLAAIIILKIENPKIVAVTIIALLTLLLPSIIKLYSGSIFFGDIWIFFGYLFVFCLMYITGKSLLLKEKFELLEWFFFFAITASVISTLIALMQWLRVDHGSWIVTMPPNSRPFGNMAQPNNLSTLLCIGLSGIYFLHERKIAGTHIFATLSTIIIIGIALTQSRTAAVSLFLMAALWAYKKEALNTAIKKRHIALFALFFLGLTLAIPKVSTVLLLNSSSLAERAASLERLDIYRQFSIAIWDGPVFGYGINQIAEAQLLTAKKYSTPIQVEYTHNLVLDLMTWFGLIPGLTITLILFFCLFKNLYRSNSTEKIFPLLAATPIVTHSLLEYPHAYAFFLIPLGLLIGMSSYQPPSSVQKKEQRLFDYIFPATCGFFVLLTWHEYLQIESDSRIMRLQSVGIDIVSEKKPSEIYLLTQLSEFIRFARTQAHREMTDGELSWMKTVSYRYPYPPCIFRYSIALALNGFEPEALESLKNIKRLYGAAKYDEAVDNLKFVPGIPASLITLAIQQKTTLEKS
ncbi:PglL family O-oligosaccharyltransferase [Pseudomonas oryzihabitans]|uniref:PglL family O-oligosaccharyltransferase n=1 Tax=Pseudomonas oryzihabitans TaxID=47885 RepID=UPI0015E3BE73|nr:O-antigen ligase family protein [Pseudomonas psychrotolerans]MBA1259375.1 hypothetical protein [Pseudomonas psychrotolerans]